MKCKDDAHGSSQTSLLTSLDAFAFSDVQSNNSSNFAFATKDGKLATGTKSRSSNSSNSKEAGCTLDEVLSGSGGCGPENWRRQLREIVDVGATGTVEEFHNFLVDLLDQDSQNEAHFVGLCAAMLSSQTRDAVTLAAVRSLVETHGSLYNGRRVLHPEAVANATTQSVEQCLRGVNYYKQKSKHLQAIAKQLCHSGSIVPQDFDDLVALPGVGPKVANLVRAVIFGKVENVGMIVDTHVHRIAQRLGWTSCEDAQPEQARRKLELFIPESIREITTRRLIGFGQEICKARKPLCQQCPLASSGLCPSIHIEDLAAGIDSAETVTTPNSFKRIRSSELVIDLE